MSWIKEKISTFRFQVLGVVIASVLNPFLLGGWFTSSRIKDLLRNQVYSDIETRTQKLSEQLANWLGNRSG